MRLATGNASWWKALKYRRETARELLRLRREGYRLKQVQRLPQTLKDTRRFSLYHLYRER